MRRPDKISALRFLLLAPAGGPAPAWSRPHEDQPLYDSSIRAIQRFRGRVYRKDGAIQTWQLDSRGGFPMLGDDRSWHLVLVSEDRQVAGCARYLVHSNTTNFEDLILRNAALARDWTWGKKMRAVFETELRLARAEGVPYVELGGWALGEAYRGTKAALRILLASYAWARLVGGCRSACTATVRHGSSSILRKIGGTSFEYFGEQLPSYNDPAYGCEMELLRFDWRNPNPRFLHLVHEVEAELKQAPIIANGHRRNVPARHPSNGTLVA